jgi:hypothetical protein
MTADSPPSIDRLYDLLADRAVGRLTAADRAELTALQAKWPHVADDALDLAAAAADMALSPPADRLPPALFARVLADAPDHLPIVRPPTKPRPLAWAGWAVAAGLAGWLAWVNTVKVPPPGPVEIAKRPTAVKYPAKAGAGEVVWDGASQQGFVTVRGLPPNDPSKVRYQLWVVDAGRTDPEHAQPVDGGLFDVAADGTATVPVRPALPVLDAAAFAVTREVPEGVVVSAGPHLAVFSR